MAQPAPSTYIQTIPITANIQPFRGLRADGELHFQPGSDVRTWLDSVDAYFLAAGITQDAEKIARVSTIVDRSCGDAAVVVARTAAEFHSQNVGRPEGSVDFPLQQLQNLRSVDTDGTVYEY